MADGQTVRVAVRLLTEDDAVDELRQRRPRRRQPENVHRRQIALQPFGQAHEVPHGKDVMAHERPQARHSVDCRVERMLQEVPAEPARSLCAGFRGLRRQQTNALVTDRRYTSARHLWGCSSN